MKSVAALNIVMSSFAAIKSLDPQIRKEAGETVRSRPLLKLIDLGKMLSFL